jgi:hypothetical protein
VRVFEKIFTLLNLRSKFVRGEPILLTGSAFVEVLADKSAADTSLEFTPHNFEGICAGSPRPHTKIWCEDSPKSGSGKGHRNKREALISGDNFKFIP